VPLSEVSLLVLLDQESLLQLVLLQLLLSGLCPLLI
jgi:hypothetical protein